MMPDEVASPCIDVCVMDDQRGLCRGCYRTLDEIAGWGSYSRARKLAVLAEIAHRKSSAADGNAPPGRSRLASPNNS
jgi:predicted Fe-S protein YdhL (DUF1289 family)